MIPACFVSYVVQDRNFHMKPTWNIAPQKCVPDKTDFQMSWSPKRRTCSTALDKTSGCWKGPDSHIQGLAIRRRLSCETECMHRKYLHLQALQWNRNFGQRKPPQLLPAREECNLEKRSCNARVWQVDEQLKLKASRKQKEMLQARTCKIRCIYRFHERNTKPTAHRRSRTKNKQTNKQKKKTTTKQHKTRKTKQFNGLCQAPAIFQALLQNEINSSQKKNKNKNKKQKNKKNKWNHGNCLLRPSGFPNEEILSGV